MAGALCLDASCTAHWIIQPCSFRWRDDTLLLTRFAFQDPLLVSWTRRAHDLTSKAGESLHRVFLKSTEVKEEALSWLHCSHLNDHCLVTLRSSLFLILASWWEDTQAEELDPMYWHGTVFPTWMAAYLLSIFLFLSQSLFFQYTFMTTLVVISLLSYWPIGSV